MEENKIFMPPPPPAELRQKKAVQPAAQEHKAFETETAKQSVAEAQPEAVQMSQVEVEKAAETEKKRSKLDLNNLINYIGLGVSVVLLGLFLFLFFKF